MSTAEESDKGMALGNLVQLCVGKKLDKSNQFSNWENRPLRQEQRLYAALDAYCLIEIYDVIQRQCEKAGIHFNELINCFLNESKTKLIPKKAQNQRQNAAERNNL